MCAAQLRDDAKILSRDDDIRERLGENALQGFGPLFKTDAKCLAALAEKRLRLLIITGEPLIPRVPLPLTPVDGEDATRSMGLLEGVSVHKRISCAVINLAWAATCRGGNRREEHQEVQFAITQRLLQRLCPLHFGSQHAGRLGRCLIL